MYQIVRIRRNERHVCCRVQKSEVLDFDFDFPSWDLEISVCFSAFELRNIDAYRSPGRLGSQHHGSFDNHCGLHRDVKEGWVSISNDELGRSR
jgi:hypothetical protein